MNKRYRLLKDLPKSKAGSIFSWDENMKAFTNEESIWMHQYEVFGKLESNDWFEEIKEETQSNDSFQWDKKLVEECIWEYFGSPNTRAIVDQFERTRTEFPKPQADNDRWAKEVIAPTSKANQEKFKTELEKVLQAENKPDWEILSVIQKGTFDIYFNTGGGWFSGDRGTFHTHNYDGYKIRSVKRLSDGEVFSINDYAGKRGYEEGYIKEFKIVGTDMYAVINHQLHHTINFLIGEIEKFPPKPQPQKEEQRIEVEIEGKYFIEYGNYHALHFKANKDFPNEKMGSIKQAIERALNDEEIINVDKWVLRDTYKKMLNEKDELIGALRAMINLLDKKYTEKELLDAEEEAFNAGRKKDVNSLSSFDQRPYYMYPTFTIYKNSQSK